MIYYLNIYNSGPGFWNNYHFDLVWNVWLAQFKLIPAVCCNMLSISVYDMFLFIRMASVLSMLPVAIASKKFFFFLVPILVFTVLRYRECLDSGILCLVCSGIEYYRATWPPEKYYQDLEFAILRACWGLTVQWTPHVCWQSTLCLFSTF